MQKEYGKPTLGELKTVAYGRPELFITEYGSLNVRPPRAAYKMHIYLDPSQRKTEGTAVPFHEGKPPDITDVASLTTTSLNNDGRNSMEELLTYQETWLITKQQHDHTEQLLFQRQFIQFYY